MEDTDLLLSVRKDLRDGGLHLLAVVGDEDQRFLNTKLSSELLYCCDKEVISLASLIVD